MEIFIKKKILEHENVNSAMVSAYIALCCVHKGQKLQYVTVDMLCSELCAGKTYTKYFRQDIAEAIEHLNYLDFIRINERIGKNKYMLDLQPLKIEKGEYFVKLSQQEVQKIYNLEVKNKHALMRYYAVMMGSINFEATVEVDGELKSNFIGFMSVEYLATISCISKSSALRYNEILEQNNIIYIHRSKFYDEVNGQIQSQTNHYGRRADAKFIYHYAQNYALHQKNKVKKKSDGDLKRSMMQKYNALLRGVEYPYSEILQIQKFIQKHNEKQKQIIAENKTKDVTRRAQAALKDEAIFESILGKQIKQMQDIQEEPDQVVQEETQIEEQQSKVPKVCYGDTEKIRNPKKKKDDYEIPVTIRIGYRCDCLVKQNPKITDDELLAEMKKEFPEATDEDIEKNIRMARLCA